MPFASLLAGVVGLAPWSAWQGVGSMLTLEFGEPQPEDAAGHARGSWSLWVQMASWRIEAGRELLAGSEDSREVIAEALDRICGRRLTGVSADGPVLDATFDFEGVRLKTFSIYAHPAQDGEPYDNWMFFCPDRRVLVVGQDERWSLDASDMVEQSLDRPRGGPQAQSGGMQVGHAAAASGVAVLGATMSPAQAPFADLLRGAFGLLAAQVHRRRHGALSLELVASRGGAGGDGEEDWFLIVWAASWRLEENGQILAAEGDEVPVVEAVLTRLQDRTLTGVSTDGPALDTTFDFGGLLLRTFSVCTRPDGDHNIASWAVYRPSGDVVVMKYAGTWQTQPCDPA